MTTGKRQAREWMLPTAVFLLLFALLLRLGWWQWERGEEKQQRWSRFESAATDTVVQPTVQELEALTDYRCVSLRGHYLSGQQFLLDNRPEEGRPGMHVLTPFRLEATDALILVDRGWLPVVADEMPDITIPESLRTISGRLATLPQPGLDLGTGEVPASWPKLMQFPDMDDLREELQAAGLDEPVVSRILWLDVDAESGFERRWSPGGMPPERHFAYSFQWLALAATLLIIYIVMLRRWLRRTDDNDGKAT